MKKTVQYGKRIVDLDFKKDSIILFSLMKQRAILRQLKKIQFISQFGVSQIILKVVLNT